MSLELRIALVLRPEHAPAWIAALLDKLEKIAPAKIVFVVQSDEILSRNRSVYSRLDRLFHRPAFDAFEMIDLSRRLRDVPRGTSQQMGAAAPDVLLNLDSSAISSQAVAQLKLGVWSFEHGRLNETLVTQLIARNGRGEAPVLLAQSASLLQLESHVLSLSAAAWKAASFVARSIQKMLNAEKQTGRLELPPSLPALDATQPLKESLPRLALGLIRTALFRTVLREQWRLFFYRGGVFAREGLRPQPLVPPPDRFWADPHAVFANGKHHVFIEEAVYGEARTQIAHFTIDANGVCSIPHTVLERPYSLSFPSLFTWKGAHYMLPETSQNRTIEVYRCDDFPDKWSLAQVLMEDIQAVDANIFFFEERWWLFANVCETSGGSTHDELHLYFADEPLSRHWQPHPENPIVSDVRRARPAGNIFREAGKIFRPAQVCSPSYGYGIRIHEILTLTPEHYREREIEFLEPKIISGLTGLHTLSTAEGLTIFDGRQTIWRRPLI